jgi:tight adherence protein C
VGGSVVAGVGLALVHPLLGPAGLGLLAVAWWCRARRASRQAAAALLDSLPDVVDLLVLAAAGGAGARGAVDAVARHGHGPVARAFAAVLRDVDGRGARLADRLEALPDDLDPALGPVVHPLVAAERYGTPLGPPLALAGRDLRQVRRHRAEEAIRRVPVKLVFPLVCCTLPAFGVLTILPLLVASLRHLAR